MKILFKTKKHKRSMRPRDNGPWDPKAKEQYEMAFKKNKKGELVPNN